MRLAIPISGALVSATGCEDESSREYWPIIKPMQADVIIAIEAKRARRVMLGGGLF